MAFFCRAFREKEKARTHAHTHTTNDALFLRLVFRGAERVQGWVGKWQFEWDGDDDDGSKNRGEGCGGVPYTSTLKGEPGMWSSPHFTSRM